MASPSHGTSTSSPQKVSDPGSKELRKLRNILLAPEHSQLENIQNKLDSLAVDEKSVGRVLPHAILLRSKQDTQLAKSLSPIIEDGFRHSIEKSPQKIADAISPIMAPAIRNAILSALRGMVQSLNQTLEHSVSWKGLQWRVEAFRTGKPFAEIVLLNTLRFRVEQVFLIHRKTGLLLHHVAADVVAIQDEELVSGMLTAIQDFVRDSFGGGQSDSLESLRVGELTVWIEQGSRALLAGVIRGTPPLELRGVFQQALEAIHLEFPDEFSSFSGEQGIFEKTRPHLEGCLQAQFEGRSSKPSPFLWVMLSLLCVGFVVWGVLAYIDQQRWTTFVQKAEKEPGIILTSFDEDNGTVIVNGLRDPLAVQPMELLEQAGLDTESIAFHLEPYFAVSPHFLELRARSVLQPPASVEINIENTQLHVTGQAKHRWIRQLGNLPQSIPGLTKVVTEHLTDTDLERFGTLRKRLEGSHFLFPRGSARLPETGGPDPASLTKIIQELDYISKLFRQKIRIEIRGQTSQEGLALRNKRLRLARAYSVWEALRLKELTSIHVVPVETESLESKGGNVDSTLTRRVTFKVLPENRVMIEKGILK
ncbi:MAG: OmpA family protein [Nitrospirales bacterium]